MFEKSRRKIIGSIMASLVALLAITLSIILFVNIREENIRSSHMLEEYVERYSLEQSQYQHEVMNGKPHEDGSKDFRLSTFYSIAFDNQGEVVAFDDRNKDVYDQEELESIASQVLSQEKETGKINNLRYLVKDKGDYTLVAFMDNTVTDGSLMILLHNMIGIGLASLVVLFFISLFLARRIIKPLEENDIKQKQFISDASHELKTPVAVISANAEMLQRELGKNEWLENIQYENERMGQLVHQLLNVSRAENMETPKMDVDISSIVMGETLAFESMAFEKGKELHTQIQEGLHCLGRQDQLSQLVSVLLDNAIDHSTGKDIELSLNKEGNMAILKVSNPCEELSSDQLENLFDCFYRTDQARSDQGGHYGLGLSIAKAIVQGHSGKIYATYQEGKITFQVQIPIK